MSKPIAEWLNDMEGRIENPDALFRQSDARTLLEALRITLDYIECCKPWLPELPEDDPRVDAYYALIGEAIPTAPLPMGWDTGHPRGCRCWGCGP